MLDGPHGEAFSLWLCHPRSFEDETAWATPEAMTTKYVTHSPATSALTALKVMMMIIKKDKRAFFVVKR